MTAPEKPTKKKGSKSDQVGDEDAPSPSDAASAPDATETRTADSSPVGAGQEDFGTTIVQAQKHVRFEFFEKRVEKSSMPTSPFRQSLLCKPLCRI